jgi:hypothetical protein
MAELIGYQDGIEAARQRWRVLDPGRSWPDKLATTLITLKNGHNEYMQRLSAAEHRLSALEEAVRKIPFPVGSSSPGA